MAKVVCPDTPVLPVKEGLDVTPPETVDPSPLQNASDACLVDANCVEVGSAPGIALTQTSKKSQQLRSRRDMFEQRHIDKEYWEAIDAENTFDMRKGMQTIFCRLVKDKLKADDADDSDHFVMELKGMLRLMKVKSFALGCEIEYRYPTFCGKPQNASYHIEKLTEWFVENKTPHRQWGKHFRMSLGGKARAWLNTTFCGIPSNWHKVEALFLEEFYVTKKDGEILWQNVSWNPETTGIGKFLDDTISLGNAIGLDSSQIWNKIALWMNLDSKELRDITCSNYPDIPTNRCRLRDDSDDSDSVTNIEQTKPKILVDTCCEQSIYNKKEIKLLKSKMKHLEPFFSVIAKASQIKEASLDKTNSKEYKTEIQQAYEGHKQAFKGRSVSI